MKKIEKGNTIVKSEFSITLCILYPVLAIAVGFATYYLFHYALYEGGMNTTSIYILGFCVLLMDAFAILHPLFACYDISYDGEYLLYTWKFIPRKMRISITGIEGYYTIKVPSRNNEYLTAYPVAGSSVLPSISSFFYDNYGEVIKGLPIDAPINRLIPKHLDKKKECCLYYYRVINYE